MTADIFKAVGNIESYKGDEDTLIVLFKFTGFFCQKQQIG